MKKYMVFYLIVMVYFFTSFSQDKIKLYAFYTPSHEILKNNHFLPSLQDDFDLILEEVEQTCSSTYFMDAGWTQTTLRKVDLIIRAIHENWGSFFIFSDVDIQFFGSIENDIRLLMQDNDIVMQRNNPMGVLCTGFFACRGNEKTLALWIDVKKMMENDSKYSDQISFNRCIKRHSKKNPYDIKWAYLPNTFFGGGTLTGIYWVPGRVLPIPKNIVMHHANYTKGVCNKIKQLEYVRSHVMQKKLSEKKSSN